MSVKERFNKMMAELERLANAPENLKPRDIAISISRMTGIGYRDLNTVFSYLADTSLLDYIRERQIMAAYKTIISIPMFDVQMAISVSGFDNQSSFGKKFKEVFGLTPKEAHQKKDESLLAEQLTWDVVSNGINLFDKKTVCAPKPKTRFGIDEKQYKVLQEALDLEALYEFDEQRSEVAFSIFRNDHVPMKSAFDFVDDVCTYIDYDEQNEFSIDELKMLFLGLYDVKYVYLNVVKEIGTAFDMVGEIKVLGYSPLDYSARFLTAFHNQDCFTFEEYINLAKCFEDSACKVDDNFNQFLEFVQRVMYGESPEEALCEPDYYDIGDPLGLKDDEMCDDPFIKWVNEETDFYNSDWFDDNYDEENPYYS